MIAHELAAELLKQPNLEVCFWKYMGGGDELVEVQSIQQVGDEFTPSKLVLEMYKP